MALTGTSIRSAKPKNRPNKVGDSPVLKLHPATIAVQYPPRDPAEFVIVK